MRTCLSLGRLLAVMLGVGATLVETWTVTGGSTRALVQALRGDRPPTSPWTIDSLVGDIAATLCLVAVAALAALLALAATSALASARAPRLSRYCHRLTPRACRRIVAVTCGLGLVAPLSLGGPALAGGGARPTCHGGCTSKGIPGRGLGGLGLPDLPTSPPGERGPDAARIVVTAGDSLWRLAAQRLPADASDAAIDALTRRLYAMNRSTIGGDPDLILPGITLIVPKGMP